MAGEHPAAIPVQVSQAARRCACGHCWAGPGQPCAGTTIGCHLARYLRAHRRGLITDQDLATVIYAAGDAPTPAAIVPGTA